MITFEVMMMVTERIEDLQIGDDETGWNAVLERRADFDGRFVYGVRSTGIYCRPTCPSRRPRRDQVAFFSIPDEAERAGFRPCRKCRPRFAVNPQVELV